MLRRILLVDSGNQREEEIFACEVASFLTRIDNMLDEIFALSLYIQ